METIKKIEKLLTNEKELKKIIKKIETENENEVFDFSKNTKDYKIAYNTYGQKPAINIGESSVIANSGINGSAINNGKRSVSASTGAYSFASSSRYNSVSANSGNFSVSANSGINSITANSGENGLAINLRDDSIAVSSLLGKSVNYGKNSIAGNSNIGISINYGEKSVAVNSGIKGQAINAGDFSLACCSGEKSTTINSGFGGIAINSGEYGNASNNGEFGISITTSIFGTASNIENGYSMLTEYVFNNADNNDTLDTLKNKIIQQNIQIIKFTKEMANKEYTLFKNKVYEIKNICEQNLLILKEFDYEDYNVIEAIGFDDVSIYNNQEIKSIPKIYIVSKNGKDAIGDTLQNTLKKFKNADYYVYIEEIDEAIEKENIYLMNGQM